MGQKSRIPLCGTNCGSDWIDSGTLIRTRSYPPGTVGGNAKEQGQKQQGRGSGGTTCRPGRAAAPSLPQLCLPPFTNPGPSSHPSVPQSTPTGYFGHPSNVTETTGCLLTSSEVALRHRWLNRALPAARQHRPLSVQFLQHYIGSSAGILTMQPSSFLNEPSSRFSEFLNNDARPRFERGVEQRLRDANHQQGTLRTGQTRFLQYRNGIRPYTSGGIHGPLSVGADMATSLGAYYIHSAIWVRATQTSSGRWTVNIIQWYVQVYDWYNWNHGQDAHIYVPSGFSVPTPPWREVIVRQTRLGTLIKIPDNWFRDLEVSGGARTYLVYTDPFAAPASYRQPFQISAP